jgi:hypothetical protein
VSVVEIQEVRALLERARHYEACHIAGHMSLRVTHQKLATSRRVSNRWKAVAKRLFSGRRLVERVSIRLAEQVSELCGEKTGNISDAVDVVRSCSTERDELRAALNTPQTVDFVSAVANESAHQRLRWGADQDTHKTPADWFWLIGYLAGKALSASIAGDVEKARHHTISTAAVLSHWHASLGRAEANETSEATHG